MELILGLLAWLIITFVWNGIIKGGRAASRASQGGGTFSDNLSAEFRGFGPFRMRLVPFSTGEEEDDLQGIGVEVRGLIPVRQSTELAFVTSVLDVTPPGPKPVLCQLERFQELETTAFADYQKGGSCNPGSGFASWARVGTVLPDLLIPPHGGARELEIILRVVNAGLPLPIHLGYDVDAADSAELIYRHGIAYKHTYYFKGYEESARDADEARSLTIQLAVAVAMADGDLDDSEGETVRQWTQRAISPYEGGKRDHLRSLYNSALQKAYEDARSGDLSLSLVTSRLNEIGEAPQKYEAIELCFDVMAADGVADANEMQTIRRIAEALELDYREIEQLRDRKLVDLDSGLDSQAGLEDLIGIEDSWTEEEIRSHIRTEFRKWNDRLNNLPEGTERDRAQQMLDMLSEARRKYG